MTLDNSSETPYSIKGDTPSVRKNISTDKLLISIITVSFNSAEYIEETILSVINQDYDNIEYIIIDGQSTDDTLKIIKQYEEKIDYLVSEPDGSMYEAINKGMAVAQGDYLAILNSDDKYVDNSSITRVVEHLNRDLGCNGIYGDIINLYNNDIRYKKVFQVHYKQYLLSKMGTFVPHMSLFLRNKCIATVGNYNIEYKHASDFDFILRCFKLYNIKYVNMPIAYFRVHEKSITASPEIMIKDVAAILTANGINEYSSYERFFTHMLLWGKYYCLNILYGYILPYKI